jgi:hypothetical protein
VGAIWGGSPSAAGLARGARKEVDETPLAKGRLRRLLADELRDGARWAEYVHPSPAIFVRSLAHPPVRGILGGVST